MPLSALPRLVPVCLFLTATWFARLCRRKTLFAGRCKKGDDEFTARILPNCTCPVRRHIIDVTDDPFRPQPRMDREKGGGMTVTVGRIRKDPIIENGIKYVCLAHNTKLGAAKGALQTAEYLVKNYLKLVK
jgi:hypothetical protein